MRLFSTLALALALAGSPAQAAERTKLTVYTALENDQLGPFKAAIERAVPEAEVVWVRDSTGVITARFLAEKDNPRADMVIGLAASSLLMFEKFNLLAEYKPAGADALKEAFRDPKAPYTWTGMDAYLGVVCFNTAEAARDGVKTPQRWEDLLQPDLKGKIVMPHPASSGTGYLMVAGWLQSMGEEKGWAFMDRLHENIAAYLHSGSAPCVQAARGERTAGLSSTCAAPPRRPRARRLRSWCPPTAPAGTRRRWRWWRARRTWRWLRRSPTGGDQGRERTLREELRDRRLSGRVEHARQLPR
ncbi:ABC transporter substrate-binding protein [Methylobacterium gregans]|uniref:ABC transporter substrate-binding protein n=1 Tax=Methylobacterium gregans TaxID=374424 RepID=UPI003608BE7C